jgi:hypothetical protein
MTLMLLASAGAGAQARPRPSARADTTLPASDQYAAGGFHRFMLGSNYRDLWSAPITVPFLDLATFAGGLHPTKTGGGGQTRTLHFVTPDEQEFVFRPVYKALLMDLEGFSGTIIEKAMIDGLSASHPAAPLIAPAFLEAAGVLHAPPKLFVMPDDDRLGEYRKHFAGMLGMIEESPKVPDDAPGFAGARKIIDSEELLKRLNENPAERIDARALLRARLIDLLLNDNDRHPDQWKWARLQAGDESPWVPIPRDRDKVLVSYEGKLLKLVRIARPELVTFAGTYPNVPALFQNASELDRRLLGGLDKRVWDSVTANLTHAISDSVIEAAFRNMPAPYQSSVPDLVAKLRSRRDRLPAAADKYYRKLFLVQDIHATDAAEKATIEQRSDGTVAIRLQSGSAQPHLVRQFDPAVTKEIRLYLHEGADTAVVTGAARSPILVRVIGGNGQNVLVDSTLTSAHGSTRFYDVDRVSDVRYPTDSVMSHTLFNRRPLLPAYGQLLPAQRDYGKTMRPTFGIKAGHDLGLVPRIGMVRTEYGFRTIPYRSRIGLDVGYSTATSGIDIALKTDHRFEESAIHVLSESRMSQLEVGRFFGFGNDAPDTDNDPFHDVSQTQWTFRPALAYAVNAVSSVSLGPIVRYTVTDSIAGRKLSAERPYGFSHFGQAGMQLTFNYDSRSGAAASVSPLDGSVAKGAPWRSAIMAEVSSSAYPAAWDASGAYAKLDGVVVAHIALPVLTKPLLALRAGAEKVWGDFPYFDASFLGGSQSLRTAPRQRFAGDAALHASAELRLPLVSFPFLLPMNVGALGFAEAGRVYEDGQSPGGWHTGMAAGLWLGILSPGTSITVMATNRVERRWLFGFGFDY